MDDTDPLAKTSISNIKVISGEELVCDGVTFEWWALGDGPALVTVRSSHLGSLRDFTDGDVKEFAMSLARKLLSTETAQMPTQAADTESSTTSLKKPAWFE